MGILLRTLEQLDEAVAERLNFLYFEANDISMAMTLMAAVRFFRMDVPKTEVLKKASTAMKGFRKLSPLQGRVPLPWPLLCLVVRELWAKDWIIALWLLVTWATCARPGETLRLRKKDLVAPSDLCPHWVVILNCGSQTVVPEEVNSKRAKQMQPSAVTTSKVGELDEALLVDQPYLKGLGNLMKKVFKSVDNNDLIFPFAMYEAVRKFNLVVKKFGLEKVGVVCTYQIRHGSASTDALQGLRTLEQIQRRGRWQTLKI